VSFTTEVRPLENFSMRLADQVTPLQIENASITWSGTTDDTRRQSRVALESLMRSHAGSHRNQSTSTVAGNTVDSFG
jgi:hypothetical protein